MQESAKGSDYRIYFQIKYVNSLFKFIIIALNIDELKDKSQEKSTEKNSFEKAEANWLKPNQSITHSFKLQIAFMVNANKFNLR